MVIQHRHQPGSFDPGHCGGCAHQADLLNHYWQVQREELAFKQAHLWARRAHRHATWALWASGVGMLWRSSRWSPADPPLRRRFAPLGWSGRIPRHDDLG
jgi:hypothetical protein